MDQLPRDFKGIWIDRNIWLDQSLTYFEKILLAEIDSLNGKDGCFASNEYLCNFFQEKERKIQDGLAKLKAKGYIYVESFDGRTRVLRTNLNTKNDKSLFSTAEVQEESVKSLFSTSQVLDSAPLDIGKDTIYRREKKESKETTTTTAAVEEKKSFSSEAIYYKTPGGKTKSIEASEIYAHFLKSNFKTEVIAEAIQIVKLKQEPIGNILKLLESVCFSLAEKPASSVKSSKPKTYGYQEVPKCTAKAVRPTDEQLAKIGMKRKD
jgi:hypothetical protein